MKKFKVPERKISYGENLEKARKLSKGTKGFATHKYQEARKGSKNGAVKTTKLPEPYRTEYAQAMNHLRSIKYEVY